MRQPAVLGSASPVDNTRHVLCVPDSLSQLIECEEKQETVTPADGEEPNYVDRGDQQREEIDAMFKPQKLF